MMPAMKRFSDYIGRHAGTLAVEVVDAVLSKMKLQIPESEKDMAVTMYTQLMEFFGESLIADEKEAVPETLLDWSKKNAAMMVAAGGEVSEIVVRYPPTRDVFNDMLTRISLELELDVKENAFVLKKINEMLDISLNETIFAFERFSQQYMKETQKELIKLSAPIVPVKDNIVVLPLIGNIDSDRARHVLDHVIPALADKDVSHVIADYSGVLMINEEIASALYQIGSALRLMGIQIVVAGLRPDLAQTIVKSGIDMSRIHSFATVKQALESI